MNVTQDLEEPVPEELTVPLGTDDAGEPVHLDLHGHVWCAGGMGSGKSTTLVRIAVAAAARFSPARVQFLVVPHPGAGCLDDLAGLPHTAAFVQGEDVQQALEFTDVLADELNRRRRFTEPAAEPVLLVLAERPNFAVAAVPRLIRVLRDAAKDGPALNVFLMLTMETSPAQSNLATLDPHFTNKIVLKYFHESTQEEVLGVEAEPLPPLRGHAYLRTGEDKPRRVVIEKIGRAELGEARFRSHAGNVRARPLTPPAGMLTTEELHLRHPPEPDQAGTTHRLPLGVVDGGDSPAHFVVEREQNLIVTGQPHSGRSAVVRTVLHGLTRLYRAEEALIMLLPDFRLQNIVPAEQLLAAAPTWVVPEQMSQDVLKSMRKRVNAENGWHGPRLFVVLSELNRFGRDDDPLSQWRELLPHAPRIGLHFVISGVPEIAEQPEVRELPGARLRIGGLGRGTLRRETGEVIGLQLPWCR